MKTRIVFKFRDDLYLPQHPALFTLLQVRRDYGRELVLFYDKIPDGESENLKGRIAEFRMLLEHISLFLKEKGPSYFFNHTPVNAFNNLKKCLANVASAKLKAKYLVPPLLAQGASYKMPVFYHIFTYPVPKNSSQTKLGLLVDEMGKYTKQTPDGVADPVYLLDYVYLEEQPANPPVAHPNPQIGTTIDLVGGNQEYFQKMNFPAYPLLFDGSEVEVGVIEKGGWYDRHPEFNSVASQIDVLLSPYLNSPNDWKRTLTEPGEDHTEHGTKTLGVLLSPRDPTAAKDCVGILPADAKVYLSSFYVEPGDTGNGISDRVESMPDALANILYHFCRKGQYGQVLLLEMAIKRTNFKEEFPYIVEPAVASLVTCAFQLGHLVIVPAGNSGNDLTTNIGNLPPQKQGWYGYTKKHCLLVGAYQEYVHETVTKLIVLPSSNSGSGDVNIFAQGEEVLTTANEDNKYDIYGYTSSASAIIAGAMALLQAYARVKLGRALFPAEVFGNPTIGVEGILVYGEVVNLPELNEGRLELLPTGHLLDVRASMEKIDALMNDNGSPPPGPSFPFPRPNAPEPGPVSR